MRSFFKCAVTTTAGFLFLATLAAGDALAAEKGYGSRPSKPSQTIANLVGNPKVVVVVPPTPHAIRNSRDGRWLYGWRVCALVGRNEHLGYFLMRGDRVIEEVIGDSNPANPDTRSAFDRCGHPDLPATLAQNHQADSTAKPDLF